MEQHSKHGTGTPGKFVVKSLIAALCLTVGFAADAARAQAPKADLAALTKAAQAEGEVTFYSAATENVATAVAREFTKKYGIKASFLRLGSSPLLQRYSSEAESGKIAADLVLTAGGATSFARDAIGKGWVEPITGAGIPAVESGEFPKEFNRDVSAIVQVQLWLIAFNTSKLKAGDVPKDWADFVSPKFANEIIIPDPAVSDAYVELWSLVHKKLGDGFFEKLRALKPRLAGPGVNALQALAAGEGQLQAPVTGPQTQALKDKGAPVDTVTPTFTTGVEMQVILTNRTKAKSPNAGRLLAHWLMTPEGNKILNADPGNVSVYDKSAFPAGYSSPEPLAPTRKEEIRKLLGY